MITKIDPFPLTTCVPCLLIPVGRDSGKQMFIYFQDLNSPTDGQQQHRWVLESVGGNTDPSRVNTVPPSYSAAAAITFVCRTSLGQFMTCIQLKFKLTLTHGLVNN